MVSRSFGRSLNRKTFLLICGCLRGFESVCWLLAGFLRVIPGGKNVESEPILKSYEHTGVLVVLSDFTRKQKILSNPLLHH